MPAAEQMEQLGATDDPFANNTMSPHTFLKSMMHIANTAAMGLKQRQSGSRVSELESEPSDAHTHMHGTIAAPDLVPPQKQKQPLSLPLPLLSRRRAHTAPNDVADVSDRASHDERVRNAMRTAAAAAAAASAPDAGCEARARALPCVSPATRTWLLNALVPNARKIHTTASSVYSNVSNRMIDSIEAPLDPSTWMIWCALCILILAFSIFLSDIF